MSDLIFAFGPVNRYFVQCPGAVKSEEEKNIWGEALPAELHTIVTSHASTTIAFGPHDSWVCIYFDAEDEQFKLLLSADRQGLPQKLTIWLHELENNEATTRLGEVKLCLGPDGMFFASSGNDVCYGGWPKNLLSLLTKHLSCSGGKSFPSIVQIGVEQRIIIIGEDGDYTANLGEEYGTLYELIRDLNEDVDEEADIRKIKILYVDPFDAGHYVAVINSSTNVQQMAYFVPSSLADDAQACKSAIEATPEEEEGEEKIQLTEDLAFTRTEIVEAFLQLHQEVAEKDCAIAQYDEVLKSYDEALDVAAAALAAKNATIEQYETLIEQMRNRQQNDSYAAARAIREANAQANADFVARQRAQNLQYQTQMVTTAMQNMSTQRNVAIQNIATMSANSMANIGNW